MQHNFQAPTRTGDSGVRTSEFETIDILLLLLIRYKKKTRWWTCLWRQDIHADV